MKVIFLQDVPRVGKRHDVKEISDGYASNFLFPHRLAVPATAAAIADLNRRKQEVAIQKDIQEDLLMKNLEEIKGKILHMQGRADEKGHLFSGIRARDIVDAMKAEYRADINEGAIKLEKPLKEVGEFEIPIEINNKKSSFKLLIEKI
jgi:large subunit ribosomal protein L9